MKSPRAGVAVALALAVSTAGTGSGATDAQAPPLPAPLTRLNFGMSLEDARKVLPEARYLDQGLDFGTLKGRLVLPGFVTLSSTFRIYLQFDAADRLRQVLLERRHAAATRKSARTVQDALLRSYGKPAEICVPAHATPAAGRITWHTESWSLHLIGFDDVGAGIRTEDPPSGDALDGRPINRSREERFRSRQQRSLPRRLLIRIHGTGDGLLEPPPCGARPADPSREMTP